MKPTLFISDLHLAPDRPAANAAFHVFARGPARDAAAIYILGDLFDAWLGDDQLREPFARAVGDSLRALSDAGVALYVARGNRDFLLGEAFASAVGATLLPEQQIVDIGGMRLVVLHGDELCTGDADYQAYRTRMRSDATRRRLLALPYFVRRGIAWYLRRKSRKANALKPESIMDVEPDAVADTFRRHGVTRMIHGHTHRPALHSLDVDGQPRERIVLADWNDRGHYLEASAAGFHVREVTG
ncbi:MAG TPA: UDP-2,3-diacylglucosamine diphosphatase [Casimicrobiaceae bacterium]|nr:UDP-2,3-diacylglucosamine diphosphatase [Casimicrobiaceae bacterium]